MKYYEIIYLIPADTPLRNAHDYYALPETHPAAYDDVECIGWPSNLLSTYLVEGITLIDLFTGLSVIIVTVMFFSTTNITLS